MVRYPEIKWFTERRSNIFKDPRQSCSQQLYGRHFEEFDRVLCGSHFFKLILNGHRGAYLELTYCQPETVLLTEESFKTLFVMGQQLIKACWSQISEEEMLDALSLALILKNMVRCEKAREVFYYHGVSSYDHEEFYRQVTHALLRTPHLCPSFLKLSDNARQLIERSAHLSEPTSGLYPELNCSIEKAVLLFNYFVHVCDISGQGGFHYNHLLSLYTEQVHCATYAARQAARSFEEACQSRNNAYRAYCLARNVLFGLSESVCK